MTDTQQLHKILAAALECEEKSMQYFDWMNKAIEDNNTNMENYHWCVCQEYDGKARGLLEAYKVLTGREIMAVPSYIKNEIESLCMVAPF